MEGQQCKISKTTSFLTSGLGLALLIETSVSNENHQVREIFPPTPVLVLVAS